MKRNLAVALVVSICTLTAGYVFYNYFNVKAQSSLVAGGNKAGQKQGSRQSGNSSYGVGATPEAALTQVESGGFSFAIQADSHLDENTDLNLYKETLNNIASQKPSFLIDLGDTFMSEKFAKTQQETEQRYMEAKSYFSSLGTMPLYLVTGNHDGENGWDTKKGLNNMMLWAREARLKYFPQDTNLASFSGNTTTANYYSFVKGDVQFIVLDPFTYSTTRAKGDEDGWNYTLGKTQYHWFKNVLETSTSKYKFVFIHNLVGGYSKDARGGAEAAKYYEWGGYSTNGSYDFDKMRPGWGKPIQQLMVDNKVTAVFHGHDHFYAKQSLDGIIYQLVPQPGTPGNSVADAEKYSYREGVFLPSAGYIRVVVSPSKATVEYVNTSTDNSISIPDSYTVYPK